MASTFLDIDAPDLVFMADTHFRSAWMDGEGSRRRRFVALLESLEPGTALFLLGDIFDFYFEYRRVVSNRYIELFAAVAAAASRGVEIHFLGGNHDFWVGRFAEQELGVRLHRDEILVEAQGRRVVCAHGDLVMPRDWGYKILKSVIRNPWVIGASKWIHPDLMDAIAAGVSHGSRRLQGDTQRQRALDVAEHAHRSFFARGNDIFIMGHIHFPLHDVREGREFVILGDWITAFTFAKLTGGNLTLETFDPV
jgi:UDP-2,3-diacylglucosamine hydrolase